jgi:hypothetical protein
MAYSTLPPSTLAEQFRMMQEAERQGRTPQQSGMGGGMSAAMGSPNYATANRTFDTENESIRQQRLLAMQMLKQSADSPGMIQAGDVAVAGASPLSALAQGIRGYAGGKGIADAREQEAGILEQQAETNAEQGRVLEEEARLVAEEERVRVAENLAKEGTRVAENLAKEDTRVTERGEDRRWAEEDRKAGNQIRLDVAQLRKEGSQGQGLGIPASVKASLLRNEGATANIVDVITEIESLEAQGKSTSGPKRALVNMVPEDWRGVAEDIAFGADEQKVSAKLTAIDMMMLKAVNSDRLSNEDLKVLNGIRTSIGGLEPYQQIGRLQAAAEIMERNGFAITGEEVPPNSGGDVTDEDIDNMDAAAFDAYLKAQENPDG